MAAYVTTIRDADLDAAFAACWDVHDAAGIQFYGQEIRDRVQSAAMWWTGVLGYSAFPLYDERLAKGYGVMGQADSAQQSVVDSAANLPANVGNALNSVANGIMGSTPVLVGIGLLALYIATR